MRAEGPWLLHYKSQGKRELGRALNGGICTYTILVFPLYLDNETSVVRERKEKGRKRDCFFS
jgi:hypothetical protein